MNLSIVINELVEEKGLDREVLSSIICEGILAAYSRSYPDLNLVAKCDKKSDEISVVAEKTVVSTVVDPEKEISLRKAKTITPTVSVGETVCIPVDLAIGRVDILRAKQVIASRIRKVEAEGVYSDFKDKEGGIVLGVVHKCERNGALVKLQDAIAFLPGSLSVPGVKCVAGVHIRAILKEVLQEPRNDSQLILEQSSSEFIKRLFELEVPEVFERLVEIKKIVRIPGYKTKVVVVSNDANIDPVGTCVGVGGARIKPVLKEIGGEKIDVISEKGSQEEFVRNALKPAEVNRVIVDSQRGEATVWVDDDQRSLAIGKMGQNIALASRLVGLQISLAESVAIERDQVFVEEPALDDDKE